MKKIILCLLLIAAGFYLAKTTEPKYYDGEGNSIPQHAVKLYVISHFAILDSAEQSEVDRHFY